MQENNKVYFIGAGPGDPELITIKGKKIIDQADIIIYAGSLVNKDILNSKKTDAEVFNSAHLTLDEVIDIMVNAIDRGKRVARVHTGDPSLYGAIREQMDRLDEMNIPYAVIPGVSSVFASAAALNKEFTLPGVSQTLICTRVEGRTPVPELEDLGKLSKSRSSMSIFLSIGLIDNVQAKLLESYPKSTPVAVVYKASWPDQKIFETTLENLAETVRENNITHTAQILIGEFLKSDFELSKLYDPSFTHGFRDAKN